MVFTSRRNKLQKLRKGKSPLQQAPYHSENDEINAAAARSARCSTMLGWLALTGAGVEKKSGWIGRGWDGIGIKE
jgi:hypothetical protein